MTKPMMFIFVVAMIGGCSSDSSSPLGNIDAAMSVDGSEGAPEQFSVEFITTAGDFTVDVTRAWSPNGADRFLELVEAGFYNDCRFFRVVPGFVVQWGINGDPETNAMWSSQPIDDDPVVESNLRGYVTFAKTNVPNSRTTQLFINYADNVGLDDQGFSPFGVVRSGGMTAVDAINDEYGEEPSQGSIANLGNSYLDSEFPNLDYIQTATIVQ